MGSRFGAVSKKQKNSNIKFALGSILGVLVFILFGLIWMLQNASSGHASMPEKIPVAQNVDVNKIGVLIPLFRIEAGQKITDGMLKVQYIDRHSLSPYTLQSDTYKDINSGNYFATKLINPHIALQKDDISTSPPISSIEIPAGYRLITIFVDGRTAVEGYAKPGARVDVLWTFIQDGEKMIGTLAHFVKVASVGGNSQNIEKEQRVAVENNKTTTASLLVTEKQAKYIELARATGELSLTLVGGNEPNPEAKELVFVKMNQLLGPQKVEEEEENFQGVTYSTDPVTGKTKKYVLKNGRWSQDKNHEG